MNKKKFKKIYYTVLTATKVDKMKLRELRLQNKIAVLNLHRVAPEENPFWSPLQPKIFEELLKFLSENFEVCLFDELKSAKTEKPLAVLSFDDGYYDFIEYALPILEKYKLRANMNIVPQCVENRKPIWNVQLYNFLNSASRSLINEISLPGFNHKLNGEDAESKLRYGFHISVFLKQRPRSERMELWRQIEPVIEQVKVPQTRMMNADEIRQIVGITEIGAHSFSHESMGFEEIDFFLKDLAKCKNYFRDNLNLPLKIYAFPNGSYNSEQIEVLRREEIKHILLVNEKFTDFPTDVYSRLTVYGDTKAEIKFKSLGF